MMDESMKSPDIPDHEPTEAEIETAWRRAKPMSGRDPHLYRIAPDVLQSVIRRDRFNVRGEHGWRIEHGRPVPYRKMSLETALRRVERELRQDQRRLRGVGG